MRRASQKEKPSVSGAAPQGLLPRLFLLITCGLLRLIGLGWGIPDAMHFHSYHPDEFPVLWAARNVDFTGFSLNTHFYNYGSLYPFCISLTASLSGLMGLLSPEWRSLSSVLDLATLHLLARLITACFGIGTVYLVYRMACEICTPLYAIVAAVLMSVFPLHVIHSHYATVDVPATFWVTLTLWQAIALWKSRRPSAYIWSGIASGLAAATKYNAGLVVLAPIAAHVLAPPQERSPSAKPRSVRYLFICLTMAGVAFLLACPGAFLAPDEFWRDVSFELFQHTREGHGLVFVGTGNGWLYHLAVNLRVGMTLPLLIACLIGTGICLWKEKKPAWILLSFVLPYFLSAGASQVRFMRYMVPLLPPLAVLGALGTSLVAPIAGYPGQIEKYRELFRKWRTKVGALSLSVLLVGGWLFALTESLAFSIMFAGEDVRTTAAQWIRANVPQGASLGLTTEPWFYTPPIVPWNGGAKTKRLFEESLSRSPYRLPVLGTDARKLRQEKPDYLVISDFEYGDPLRLGLPEFKTFWDLLHQDYREIARFEKTPRIDGLDFGKKGLPPHDWLYPYPTIVVFKKGADAATS